MKNNLLWKCLEAHAGHEVSIVKYGSDWDNPVDI